MSLEIVIVRHGETQYNLTNTIQGQTDVLLNETGLQQAALAAKRLAGENFTFAYSSDLTRAVVTAKTIVPALDIIGDARLREWHLGDWQGKTLKQITEEYEGGFRAYMYDREKTPVPNGESSYEVFCRVREFLQELIEKHEEGKILIVSHGGAIKRMFKVLMGEHNSFTELPRVDNTSISRFTYIRGVWRMDSWNDTGHLAECTLLGTRY